MHETELYSWTGQKLEHVPQQYQEAVERGERGEKYEEHPGTCDLFGHRKERECKKTLDAGGEA